MQTGVTISFLHPVHVIYRNGVILIDEVNRIKQMLVHNNFPNRIIVLMIYKCVSTNRKGTFRNEASAQSYYASNPLRDSPAQALGAENPPRACIYSSLVPTRAFINIGIHINPGNSAPEATTPSCSRTLPCLIIVLQQRPNVYILFVLDMSQKMPYFNSLPSYLYVNPIGNIFRSMSVPVHYIISFRTPFRSSPVSKR